jgi:hypothetical protein
MANSPEGDFTFDIKLGFPRLNPLISMQIYIKFEENNYSNGDMD